MSFNSIPEGTKVEILQHAHNCCLKGQNTHLKLAPPIEGYQNTMATASIPTMKGTIELNWHIAGRIFIP